AVDEPTYNMGSPRRPKARSSSWSRTLPSQGRNQRFESATGYSNRTLSESRKCARSGAQPERHPLEPLFILMDHSFRIVEARRKRNPEQSGSQSNPPRHAWHERQVPHRLLVRVGLVDVE